jgi:hypothetical protein
VSSLSLLTMNATVVVLLFVGQPLAFRNSGVLIGIIRIIWVRKRVMPIA